MEKDVLEGKWCSSALKVCFHSNRSIYVRDISSRQMGLTVPFLVQPSIIQQQWLIHYDDKSCHNNEMPGKDWLLVEVKSKPRLNNCQIFIFSWSGLLSFYGLQLQMLEVWLTTNLVWKKSHSSLADTFIETCHVQSVLFILRMRWRLVLRIQQSEVSLG